MGNTLSLARANLKRTLAVALVAMLQLFFIQGALAQENPVLESVDFSVLPGDRVQVDLQFNQQVALPQKFSTNSPARIALDFEGVSNALERRSLPIGIGLAKSMTVVEAQGRTRVVFNLVSLVPDEVTSEGRVIRVLLGADGAAAPVIESTSAVASSSPASASRAIDSIDFKRGDEGEGQVVIRFNDPRTPVDLRQEGSRILVDLVDSAIPADLIRRLDVTDFATPVRFIDASQKGGNARISIETSNDFEHLAYQTDNVFTVEFKPLTAEEKEQLEESRFQFTGERLSLNFQSIEVRAVLQLIADFTGLNMVTSDSVQGTLTLRLQNVPWDQALDIILRTKGLSKRQTGNVILVAPSEEIAANEKLQLEATKQVEELAPLRLEFIPINYAKAAELSSLLSTGGQGLLSERGKVSIDERTNTLMVQETAARLDEIRNLIAQLDVPVRQVLIEARIVIADNRFREELGVRFGLSDRNSDGALSGNIDGNDTLRAGNTPSVNDRLLVDLPTVSSAAGSVAFQLSRVTDGTLLDLELSALQNESLIEIVASPRLITSNQSEAFIESGEEIPYQNATSSGATSVEFKKAVLSLKVTPQITPDNRVIMDLSISLDSRGEDTTEGPAINTQEINTQVLIENGETVVLGGIFNQTKTDTINKVPVLGDLPFVGWLFRRTINVDDKRELLIFVTPKIIKDTLSVQ
ncbi:type IV pilus secretin PilQ [Pelagibaculum spongiae]|uniref:Type IV pilus secretin PilQ n=1 Tax=Pelagibaculum spongiae TaxID=2080658 RepID=A0A2V1GUE7_9GAMM|nr:type IV pilus secretin PilQ [Pelagibaculum spongiae]PVZ68277.1 type IV pilus secretin PilQ [Pelagibaculum spongiae]